MGEEKALEMQLEPSKIQSTVTKHLIEIKQQCTNIVMHNPYHNPVKKEFLSLNLFPLHKPSESSI